MAEDQVKYSDLIVDDGAIDALDKRLDNIKRKMSEVKGEAATLSAETRNLSTATREQQQSVSQNAAAVENLRQKMKGLTDEQKQLEAERRKYAKLTEQEANRVKAMAGVYQQYAAAVREGKDAQMKALPTVDMQNKSYNELYQTYNALKDALNKMTVAERENTAAGKSMVDQAKEIRDTLNNLQQATGNYVLNVGNYASALNGLKFQFQQIAREIPSAQNLQQFFLAISNNIPQFADAMARYKKDLPEIRDKFNRVTEEIARQRGVLDTLVEGSTEHEQKLEEINGLVRKQKELSELNISPMKALWQAAKSWQTWLVLGLLVLRKIPDIVKWIGSLFESTAKKIARLKNEIDSTAASTSAMAAAIQKTADETTALDLIVDSLKDITRGTDEWKTAIEAVNDITKSNLDYTKATLDDVYKVTAAYRDQAYQLALNNELMTKIANSQSDKLLTLEVLKADKFETVASLMGINIGTDEYEKMYKKWWDARRDQNFKKFGNSITSLSPETLDFFYEDYLNSLDKFGKDALDFLTDVRKKYNRVLSSDATADLKDMYRATPGIKTPTASSTPKEEKTSEQSVTDRYWEAEKALLEAQYEGYQLEQELAKLNRDKARDEQINWYVDQRLALDENLKNGFITQQKYDQDLAELDRQNNVLREDIDKDYWAELRKLRSENLKERQKEWKANAEEVEKTAKEEAKAKYKALADSWQEERMQLVVRGAKRKELVDAEITAEVARLNTMLALERSVNGEKMTPEEKSKIEEWIKLLEKMQKAGNFGDMMPGQIFGKGAANVTSERKNYANIWEVLGVDMDSNQVSALDNVFDQAKAALSSWVDARKEAADTAKELADDEVSAAENALNREIELRNQGYANNVALREKELADAKKQQEEAVKLQEKAKKEELAINTAMEASNMAVAIANLFKQFGYWAIPLTAVMIGAWTSAKVSALNSIRSTKYREGGVMLLEGGSHESGHDVNLGIGPDGSNLRAEGGEYFAVINKRNSRKYGSEIPAVVNALNSGMFEDRYIKTSDAVGLMPRVVATDNGHSVDLSAVESGVGQLVKQGEKSWSTEGGYRVMRYKNLTRRVKIG